MKAFETRRRLSGAVGLVACTALLLFVAAPTAHSQEFEQAPGVATGEAMVIGTLPTDVEPPVYKGPTPLRRALKALQNGRGRKAGLLLRRAVFFTHFKQVPVLY